MAHVTLKAPAIHCEHCARTIRDGLDMLPGIHRITVDVAAGHVAVEFDPEETSLEAIQGQLEHFGFPAAPLSDEAEQPEREPQQRLSRSQWYALLAAGVVILALVGYGGYALYPRFGLPAGEGASLLLLAVAAGVASFFSPCSFPLLVTLLARQGGAEPEQRPAFGSAIPFALALSLGAASFFVLSGLILGVGGEALFAEVTFVSTAGRVIRLMVGLLLIALGAMQLGWLPVSFEVVEQISRPLMQSQARQRRRHPVTGFAILGFAYPIAGFG